MGVWLPGLARLRPERSTVGSLSPEFRAKWPSNSSGAGLSDETCSYPDGKATSRLNVRLERRSCRLTIKGYDTWLRRLIGGGIDVPNRHIGTDLRLHQYCRICRRCAAVDM